MKARDWLRAKAQQRSMPASWEPNETQEVTLTVDNRSGAYTTPNDLQRVAPLVVAALDGRTVAAAPDEPQPPTGFIRIERALTKADAEQIRQQSRVAIASVPSWNSRCDCWPQYIDCCCKQRRHAKQQ